MRNLNLVSVAEPGGHVSRTKTHRAIERAANNKRDPRRTSVSNVSLACVCLIDGYVHCRPGKEYRTRSGSDGIMALRLSRLSGLYRSRFCMKEPHWFAANHYPACK